MDGSPFLSLNIIAGSFFKHSNYISSKFSPVALYEMVTILRVLLLFILLLISMPSYSNDKLFMVKPSPITDDKKLLSSVKKSFFSRQWTVIKESESALTGTIDHRGVVAEVTIYLADNELRYLCNGTRETTRTRTGGGGTGRKIFKSTKEFCPEKWVNNLKKDTRSFYYK